MKPNLLIRNLSRKIIEDFIQNLSTALKQPLPGLSAQLKMAPETRKRVDEKAIKENLKHAKKAAVLCLFYPRNHQPHFVLMKRVSYPGVHSGQISFPGGKIEGNESPLEAAIRETKEEIGIEINEEHILSAITDIYIPPSNFYVYPFIACLKEPPIFDADNTEVDYLIEVPLKEFTNPTNKKRKELTYSYGTFEAPYFHLQNETVWGATAMMLGEVFEILRFD